MQAFRRVVLGRVEKDLGRPFVIAISMISGEWRRGTKLVTEIRPVFACVGSSSGVVVRRSAHLVLTPRSRTPVAKGRDNSVDDDRR